MENQLKHLKVFWNGKALDSENYSKYGPHFEVSLELESVTQIPFNLWKIGLSIRFIDCFSTF